MNILLLGDSMPFKHNPSIFVFIAISLSILITYQLLITFILPFRYNIFILTIEIILFFLCISRIIWF
jgi:hypothetical protein